MMPETVRQLILWACQLCRSPEPPDLQPLSPFDGTAPVGTLTDAVSVYTVAGDPSRALRVDMTTSQPVLVTIRRC